MKLRELCYARSGDKGDISNIVVLPHDPETWEWVRDELTIERIAPAFAGIVIGKIERFELPGIRAVNFVLHGALGGGVSSSLRADPHGKSLQALILDIDVLGPDSMDTEHERL